MHAFTLCLNTPLACHHVEAALCVIGRWCEGGLAYSAKMRWACFMAWSGSEALMCTVTMGRSTDSIHTCRSCTLVTPWMDSSLDLRSCGGGRHIQASSSSSVVSHDRVLMPGQT